MSSTEQDGTRERVRARYAEAAARVSSGAGNTDVLAVEEGCCSAGSCAPDTVTVEEGFGAGLYSADEHAELPAEALAASLGCGNPLAVAELRAGETVLDLGSGGGIDVLLSAGRVGPSGFAYGVDMTDEMLALARANAAKANATNVEFVKGTIENVPLPDQAVDVIISNCVINLSVDKPAVIGEMFRLLKPGGRIGVSDVVAEDHLSPAQRAERGSYVGCIAGALSRGEYLGQLAAAGFIDTEVVFTHQAAEGMHAAIVRATKPATPASKPAARTAVAAASPTASGCCSSAEHASCCEPSAMADCCRHNDTASTTSAPPTSCGCR
jgi:arsenite methyltransferase